MSLWEISYVNRFFRYWIFQVDCLDGLALSCNRSALPSECSKVRNCGADWSCCVWHCLVFYLTPWYLMVSIHVGTICLSTYIVSYLKEFEICCRYIPIPLLLLLFFLLLIFSIIFIFFTNIITYVLKILASLRMVVWSILHSKRWATRKK